MSDSADKKLLLSIPVVDVLAHYGKRVDHRGYMYYSPFRDEATPSMRVTVNRADGTWMWADYGGVPSGGKFVDGGGCLDLVCRLGNLSGYGEAMAVLEEIAAGTGREVIRRESEAFRRQAPKASGIVIDAVSPEFTRRSLVRYATKVRGIPMSLLSRYCRQVTYHTKADASRTYTVIGFPNNAGGWALRGSGDGRKINSVWGLSTIGSDGTLRKDASASSDKCLLFEGFMDFLSFLSWRGTDSPGADVCVMHSASNAVHVRDYVLAHDKVRTFFDNDEAGTRATEMVRAWCGEAGKDFKDGRTAYSEYNDVNDAWKEALQRRNGESRAVADAGVRKGPHK